MLRWKHSFVVMLAPAVLALGAAPTPRTAVDPPLRAMLDSAYQDEHVARSIYARVLTEHGTVMPFANIVHAEQRHADHVSALLTARGEPTPVPRATPERAPSFASVREACVAAITAEEENIAMYDRFLARELPDDVKAVFEQNRWASVERHLPAFQRCVARGR
ncbi:MAG: DUF2202 domain-containing protein [Gammaproteobacteria bacterium]|nr:DUF2202 domain-containing protein [Gammaproteobacteria bacterium]